jgi:hypothetical protein
MEEESIGQKRHKNYNRRHCFVRDSQLLVGASDRYLQQGKAKS